MVQAEYKHPNFSSDQATYNTIKDEPSHKILRSEYPDGVIVVFEITEEGVTVHSNFGFFFNTDTNTITPKLDSPNDGFKDFI